jgi:uncharacterized membrane protein YgcG
MIDDGDGLISAYTCCHQSSMIAKPCTLSAHRPCSIYHQRNTAIRFAIACGSHVRLANESSLYRHFFQSPLFDRQLLIRELLPLLTPYWPCNHGSSDNSNGATMIGSSFGISSGGGRFGGGGATTNLPKNCVCGHSHVVMPDKNEETVYFD